MSAPERQKNNNFVSRAEYEKMVEKVKQCEADRLKVMTDQGNIMKEFNKRMQVHLEEIRLLKDVNQKLQADLQELRDLTCYLDDDRQKCRKLAREWQRFGRYTASVMRNEVATYQEKLKVLEEKQMDLSRDNAELKELCLYLDRQRESVAMEHRTFCSKCSQRIGSVENLSQSAQNISGQISGENGDHERNSHSQRLEARLTNIHVGRSNEHSFPGKESLASTQKTDVTKKRVSFTFPGDIETDTESIRSDTPPRIPGSNGLKNGNHAGILRNGLRTLPKQSDLPFPSPNKMTPEAVEQAMKVLEIHERLENPGHTSNPDEDESARRLGDHEVEVLKEMCNVVWRKLSDQPDQRQNDTHSSENGDEILEDLL
ncbi:coiled-coil domain-containing protein 85C-like [Montipora foliosa]|uniref:coiled-coil domain-containing protein 85C-like n=1 Tax=Montipora foliosa TaxID=591990 RepID=UPI0035F217CD